MRIYWRRFQRWFPGHRTDCAFLLLFLLGVGMLLSPFLGWIEMNWGARAALFSGLLAGAVVWWQVYLLVRQLAYGAVLELDREWNSTEMLGKRRLAWIVDKETPNLETVEDVLEFLEKVSTLERDKFIARELVWDTLGWYISRYFYYCRDAIRELRTYWTGKSDPTLYCDLEQLYRRLIQFEADKRNLEVSAIEEEYHYTKGKFIQAEGAGG
jgi:hypothetical protein